MRHASWSLHRPPVKSVIGTELVAAKDAALGWQQAHWSTAKLMEQPQTGKYALQTRLVQI